MPKGKKKVDSREVGLQLGLIFFKYFLKTEHLHYGYWAGDFEVELLNLPRAQERYSEFLRSHIPEGVKTILDVGCGVGTFALQLVTLGYTVDCVSPSPLLTQRAQELLQDKSRIFNCKFEDLRTEKRYDLILFSESFQYVNVPKALQNISRLLSPGGYLLISDFFCVEAKGKSAVGGGHRLADFYAAMETQPFIPVKNIDITNETAPTLTIASDFFINVGLPVWNLIFYLLNNNHPVISRLIQWKYRKKIEKINRKYFSGEKYATDFKIFKTYRVLLYKNEPGAQRKQTGPQ